MPTANVPTPITLPARRAAATAIVADVSGLGILTASLLVDVVDVVTAAALGSVGLDSVEVRRAAAAMWERTDKSGAQRDNLRAPSSALDGARRQSGVTGLSRPRGGNEVRNPESSSRAQCR